MICELLSYRLFCVFLLLNYIADWVLFDIFHTQCTSILYYSKVCESPQKNYSLEISQVFMFSSISFLLTSSEISISFIPAFQWLLLNDRQIERKILIETSTAYLDVDMLRLRILTASLNDKFGNEPIHQWEQKLNIRKVQFFDQYCIWNCHQHTHKYIWVILLLAIHMVSWIVDIENLQHEHVYFLGRISCLVYNLQTLGFLTKTMHTFTLLEGGIVNIFN